MTFDEFWMRQQYTESKDDKWFAEKVWQAATLAEREECAKVCDEFDSENPHIGQATAVAAAIRAHSNEKETT